MPRRLSVPHERRKAKLQAHRLSLQVQIAERRERLDAVKQELRAMTPPKKPNEPI